MFSKSLKAARRGFTLIEIMIVVLIIGILLAIAVPNFVKARESSRTKSCISNLQQIDSAKEQYAMDQKLASGAAAPSMANLTGVNGYIKSIPTCPSTGASYDTAALIGAIGVNPTCPNPGVAPNAHVLP